MLIYSSFLLILKKIKNCHMRGKTSYSACLIETSSCTFKFLCTRGVVKTNLTLTPVYSLNACLIKLEQLFKTIF